MTPEEWQAGMHNEAGSVDDDVWAKETRFAAAQAKPRSLWFDVLVNAAVILTIPLVFWAYWTAMVNCRYGIQETPLNCWANDHLGAIDGLTLIMLLGFPFLLGLLRVRLSAVLLTFALVPVVKSLWPAVMPLLDLQPHTEEVFLPPLHMLDYVRFGWGTVQQIIVSPLLAWLGWSLGRSLGRLVGRKWANKAARA